jgi:hypothetical protein
MIFGFNDIIKKKEKELNKINILFNLSFVLKKITINNTAIKKKRKKL